MIGNTVDGKRCTKSNIESPEVLMKASTGRWEDRSLASCLHGFSHLGTLRDEGPLIVERGEGIYVYDTHNKRYIEGNSGLWNIVAGFNNKTLIEAGYEQLCRFPAYHTFFGRNNEPAILLAEQLLSIAPVPMSKVFFTNSGSEANDSVVKMLWMIHRGLGQPERRKLISRKNGYHGTTVMAASLTGKDYNRAFGLPLDCVHFADCPHYWRYAKPGESESNYVQRLVTNLTQLIEAEGPDTIAGFFAEPVMGAGGVVPPPEGYFSAIQAILRKYDIPFVADEVICGFGRTGKLWGCLTYDIEPDIVVVSKCLTAGYYPMGAILLSEEMHAKLMQACQEFEEFPHGFTGGGNPVGCAIANKALELIIEGGLFDNVVAVAPRFQQRLRGLSDHPMVGEARGVGLMGALEIVEDKRTKAPYAAPLEVSEQIAKTALQHGLIIRPIGDAVILAPPFIITREQIDELFDIVDAVLDAVQDRVEQDRSAAE
jgi:adenosylmethionine-8-amino-7-oxononanoate aminotransferase